MKCCSSDISRSSQTQLTFADQDLPVSDFFAGTNLEKANMTVRKGHSFVAVCVAVIAFWTPALATAESPGFVIEKIEKGIAIKVGGQPFADFVINDPETNKSYLWPVYGPTGKPMTRAFPMQSVEGEVQDHYHHRGINFGHEDIGGFDTWTERLTFDKGEKTSAASKVRLSHLGTQKHRAIREHSADANRAMVVSEIDYLRADGSRSLTEIRTMIFRVENEHRTIDFNQDFIASDGDVVFGDKKDAGLSIRVPTAISVDSKKGGKIINSEGQTDATAWGKKARWCDYSGPMGEEILGVAVLNHPSSFRHPTTWHVRTYGLFTANPFGTLDKETPNGPHTLKAGEKLELRHRFVLHKGDATAARIQDAYEAYVGKK